ncbi:MAG: CHAT domain-containing protein [Acidobacteriales bacterium]|nr:CHAT domain-containing protein [Terriglobales bacterium]
MLLFRKQDAGEAFLYLEKSRARNFQDRLAPMSVQGHPPAVTLQNTCSALSSGTVLLETWTAGQRLGLVWCTREHSGFALKEFSEDQMEGVRQLAADVPGSISDNWRQNSSHVIELLGKALPASALASRRIIVIPDGWLSAIPFELLPGDAQGARLLVEDHEIWYLPSAVILRRKFASGSSTYFPWIDQLSAFADPVLRTSQNTEQDTDEPLWQSLPGSGKEGSRYRFHDKGTQAGVPGTREYQEQLHQGSSGQVAIATRQHTCCG